MLAEIPAGTQQLKIARHCQPPDSNGEAPDGHLKLTCSSQAPGRRSQQKVPASLSVSACSLYQCVNTTNVSGITINFYACAEKGEGTAFCP